MRDRRVQRARQMRRDPTDAEAKLWQRLRNRQVEGAKFRRQVPILGYYADFLCEAAKLIVEADGGQHDAATDAARTRELEAAGFTILRFWNNDILANPDGVIAAIRDALMTR